MPGRVGSAPPWRTRATGARPPAKTDPPDGCGPAAPPRAGSGQACSPHPRANEWWVHCRPVPATPAANPRDTESQERAPQMAVDHSQIHAGPTRPPPHPPHSNPARTQVVPGPPPHTQCLNRHATNPGPAGPLMCSLHSNRSVASKLGRVGYSSQPTGQHTADQLTPQCNQRATRGQAALLPWQPSPIRT